MIRLVVMMYVRYPLSSRNVEDLLFERGIDIRHETVAGEIRRRRVQHMRSHTHWRWRLDEVYVKINGEMRYPWRAVDHEGEELESFVTKTRDKVAALKFIKKAMERHGQPKAIVTDGLRSYGAALKRSATPIAGRLVVGSTTGLRILISRFDDENEPWSDFAG